MPDSIELPVKPFVWIVVGAFVGVLLSTISGIVCAVVRHHLHGRAVAFYGSTVSTWVLQTTEDGWTIYGAFVGALIAWLGFIWTTKFKRAPLATVLLCVVICVSVGLSSIPLVQNHLDKTKIDRLYIELCAAMDEQEYDTAYGLLTPEYRKEHTLDEFVGRIATKDFDWGPCPPDPQRHVGITGNEARFFPDSYYFTHYVVPGIGLVDLSYSGAYLELEKIDGEWYFTGETAWLLD